MREIPPEAFPPPGDLPTIEAMLRRKGDGPGSQSQLKLAPPTVNYPRFASSSWDSMFITNLRRVRAKIQFDDLSGSYTTEEGHSGTLSNVTYGRQADGQFLLTGNWSLAEQGGDFVFVVPKDQIGKFNGTFTNAATGESGLWDGSRLE